MLGLKHGTVQLYEHEQEWEIEAQNTIFRLKEILSSVQHIGSTSILTIKDKSIIDIAVEKQKMMIMSFGKGDKKYERNNFKNAKD